MNTGWRRMTDNGRPPPPRSSTVGGGTCTNDWTAERHQREAREHDESAEERRPEQIHGAPRGLGAEEAADHASRQHERDRLRLVRGRGHLGRREAILQPDGVVDAHHARSQRR